MTDSTSTVEELKQIMLDFRDARDWKQFHNPKDLAIAMSIEASELLELCRFRTNEEIYEDVKTNPEYAHELADVLAYLLITAHTLGIDLSQALVDKMAINEKHYPVNLAKGKKVKYTQLQNEQKK